MKISDFNIRRHQKYYYRGDWDEAIFKKSIAVVGSRQMTRYGREVVDKFVSGFVANGITTISGFMYGVDTEVHQKTVDYGGRTVAVFGCGLDVVYPPENEKLYVQILENKGLVVSEYEAKAKPHLWKFPQRNKIVAGLSSLGVLVIEAGEKSGALITAGLAKRLGKKVYAVPGPINSSVSVGCNNLIKSGKGIIATSAADIVKMKIPESKKLEMPDNLNLTEQKIFKALVLEPLGVDEIAVKIGVSVVGIGSTLSMMSLKGFLVESGNKYYLPG
ncbi:MAG: DNA-processing protein DprA [bacterium]|nr:DNA-processing protein DprA [bacterium]